MKDLIGEVISARQTTVALQEGYKIAFEGWQQANQPLITALANAKANQEQAERQLREIALSNYEKTGEKKPAPGVEVKLRTELTYADTEALAWAFEHKIALNLDKRAFEQIAKANPLPFVLSTQVPFVALATKLEEAK